MAQQKANISFPGVMEMIKKSKRPLAPIYELVINALEAALQVRDRSEQTRTVVMHLTFSGLLSDSRKLKSIEIFDNGIGFNDENYERFDTLLDKSKGYNNRGSGRVQFLHRFDRVEVKSHFKNNEQYFFRKFESSPSRLLSNHILEIAPDVQTTGSHITLLAPNLKKTEQNLYDELTAESIKTDLRSYLALWFYLDSKSSIPLAPIIQIKCYQDNEILDERTLSASDVPAPAAVDTLKIPYVVCARNDQGDAVWNIVKEKSETICWAHFRLPEDQLEENAIWLCSKSVTVEQVGFKRIKKKQSFGGY